MQKACNRIKILILIADDDSDTRDLLRIALETKNYEVIEVADGNAMVSQAKVEKPSLIVADVMMPFIDGYEGIKKLREDPEYQKIPVLFISCIVTGEAVVGKLKSMPNCNFLEKPFDPSFLLKSIEQLLESSKQGS